MASSLIKTSQHSEHCYCCISVLIGVEGGFDLPEEKYEYDEHVKIVILPEHLDIPQDGLDGLPDMVKDRVSTVIHPGGGKNTWSDWLCIRDRVEVMDQTWMLKWYVRHQVSVDSRYFGKGLDV